MIEKYASGRQDVNQYPFYYGYTQLVFVANEVGRHTLTFYGNGVQSNSIIVDVVPYGGSYVPGYTPPAGQPYSNSVKISIGGYSTTTGSTGQTSSGGQVGQCTCPPGKIICPGFPEQYWAQMYAGEIRTKGYSDNCTCDCSSQGQGTGSNPLSRIRPDLDR